MKYRWLLLASLCSASLARAEEAKPEPTATDAGEAWRFGGVVGGTNNFVTGDTELGQLYGQAYGLLFGASATKDFGAWTAHGELLYEQRHLKHGYLGNAGRFDVDYLTAVPRIQRPLLWGIEAGAGLSLSQAVTTSIGSDVDAETRAKIATASPGPLGLVVAVDYAGFTLDRAKLQPELTFDQSLTSARKGAQVLYQTWAFALGVMLP